MGAARARRPEAAPATVPEHKESFADRFPRRILVADDNAVNLKVATRLLASLGYRADVAGNGLEVLSACEVIRYDIVFMDVQMPELDGLAASRRLCATTKPPYIIAMTANAMEGDRAACLDAGMTDYVSKPVRIDELKRALSASPAPVMASPNCAANTRARTGGAPMLSCVASMRFTFYTASIPITRATTSPTFTWRPAVLKPWMPRFPCRNGQCAHTGAALPASVLRCYCTASEVRVPTAL